MGLCMLCWRVTPVVGAIDDVVGIGVGRAAPYGGRRDQAAHLARRLVLTPPYEGRGD